MGVVGGVRVCVGAEGDVVGVDWCTPVALWPQAVVEVSAHSD